MTSPTPAKSLGELRNTDYRPVDIRNELRNNLIRDLRQGIQTFPDVIGYDETVLPQLQHAILSGHDILLLGERGQAKTRLLRSLTNLLDDYIPYIDGCDIFDDPYNPICSRCQSLISEDGDHTRIEWLNKRDRYTEKLATPDVSMADLIGDIDPIKVAEGRYLSDEFTIHYGLIPRSNRGIFCINELPDLPERIQVGMFNLMEERDIQVKGYKLQLPVDILVVATANPEDYTNRGRIITPLKDRYGAQIRTHYPEHINDEIAIMEQESSRFPDSEAVVSIPQYMKEIIASFTAAARNSNDINQRSGVSAMISIANYETVIASAMRRSVLQGDAHTAPRISDLDNLVISTSGKIELDTLDDGSENKIIQSLIERSVRSIFTTYFKPEEFDQLLESFEEGLTLESSPDKSSQELVNEVPDLECINYAFSKLETGTQSELRASALEFILEGLYLMQKVNRIASAGSRQYSN